MHCSKCDCSLSATGRDACHCICLSLHMPSGHWKPPLGTPRLMASSHCHSYHATVSLSIDHPEEVSLSSCWSFSISALARLSSSCVACNFETVASHDGAAGGGNDHCGCVCGGCGHAPPPAGCDAPPPAGFGAGSHCSCQVYGLLCTFFKCNLEYQ